ncbi:MAG: 2-C-methyl-D-erythritol 4-phosphate cytidylyltransferase [Puniceicoccaceae bacterium]|nr:MAG: 2-C-methyl-D-erythritol 4-phosphate cytidylyltransferase [Puniceicoccaceae bacterium]
MADLAAAIFLAAGSGRRMGAGVADKVLAPVAGQPALAHSLRAFRDAGIVRSFVFAYRDGAQASALRETALKVLGVGTDLHFVQGGVERQDSVLAALEVLSTSTSYVYIHDAARPLITVAALKLLETVLRRDGAAVLAHRVADTIKRTDSADGTDRQSLEDLDRARLWAVETPQAFQYQRILAAYRAVREQGLRITDDSAALAHLGDPVSLVPNSSPNLKLTSPQDYVMVEALLAARAKRG